MSDFNEMNQGPRWYVVHTYTGYENKVKANLEKIVENRGLQDLIYDIRIPLETVTEETNGAVKTKEQKVFPSYVLVKMTITDLSWHVVRTISGVTGFVGPGSRPCPLSEEEVKNLMGEEREVVTGEKPSVGDVVDIIQGTFVGYFGKLSEISDDNETATVIVSTVGRDMPIKVGMSDIKKKTE